MENKYEKFIDDFQLKDIILLSAQFKRFSDPDPEKYPEVRFNFSPEKSTHRKKGKTILVFQKFFFVIEQYADEDNAHKIFELKGEYSVHYTCEKKYDDEICRMFVERNIPVNLYPYIRELVQSTMARVGLPSFSLPALKIKR